MSDLSSSVDIRDIFIRAGLMLVAMHGPDGLSLNNILTQAGKSRGSFYAAFGSKAGFEGEIIRRYFQPVTETLRSLADDSVMEGQEKIRAWAAYSVHRLTHAVELGQRVMSLTEIAGRVQTTAANASLCDALFGLHTELISRLLIEAELASTRDAKELACLLLVMLDGVTSRAIVDRMPERVSQYFSYVIPSLSDSLLQRRIL